MAECINRHTLIGNLGCDPRIRSTQGDSKLVFFSLATTKRRPDRNNPGQWISKTVWHDIVVTGPAADYCLTHFRKGSKVYVEGEPEKRKFTNSGGVECVVTEVNVRHREGTIVPFSESRQQTNSEAPPAPAAQQQNGGPAPVDEGWDPSLLDSEPDF